MDYVDPIKRLIRAISRLPGVGEKTATRHALHMLNSKDGYIDDLIGALEDVRDSVTICSGCRTFSDANPCNICASSSRNSSKVCVVTDYKDMAAIESTGEYDGRYYILHGSLAPLKGIGPEELHLEPLMELARDEGIEEVILATAFDTEGETTATYLTKVLKPYNLVVSRLATGVPVGSYVEYMDRVTLSRAMEGRRVL